MPPELKQDYKISQALESIRQRWPKAAEFADDSEGPVFIFSAGWRSGSTLLQRLIVSSGEVAIWGEPLGEAGIIPRLGYAMATIFNTSYSFNFISEGYNLTDLSNKWIANITPDISNLKTAQRALLKVWLESPAKKNLACKGGV